MLYLLGELETDQAAAFEQQLESSPELGEELLRQADLIADLSLDSVRRGRGTRPALHIALAVGRPGHGVAGCPRRLYRAAGHQHPAASVSQEQRCRARRRLRQSLPVPRKIC